MEGRHELNLSQAIGLLMKVVEGSCVGMECGIRNDCDSVFKTELKLEVSKRAKKSSVTTNTIFNGPNHSHSDLVLALFFAFCEDSLNQCPLVRPATITCSVQLKREALQRPENSTVSLQHDVAICRLCTQACTHIVCVESADIFVR